MWATLLNECVGKAPVAKARALSVRGLASTCEVTTGGTSATVEARREVAERALLPITVLS